MNDQSLEVDQSSPNENRPHRPLKKPYKELNLAEKVELIRLAEDNVGLSQATIAERYSIAKSNVCRILQRKREYLKAFESSGFAASRKRKLKCRSTEPVDIGSSQSIIHAPIPLRPYDSNGNETLRAHMYKEHEVSRMFMCRCCNWAFPDKTSLHVHIQSKEEAKRSSLHSIPSISNGLPSAFAPLHSSLNSSPLPVLPMPFPPPAVLPQSDLLSHLKDRLLLNSLLTFPPSFSFPFLPPSTLLSTNEDKSPSSEMKEEEEDEDEEIEVRDTHEDGETPSKKVHASGDSLGVSKIPIHSTPKSTHNTKRRSADFAAGDFDESLIVDEMKKLCNEDNDFDGEPRDESDKTDTSEPSVDDYKKMIASDSYWSSKLRAQRRMAKRRNPLSSSEKSRVRRILMDESSFSQ